MKRTRILTNFDNDSYTDLFQDVFIYYLCTVFKLYLNKKYLETFID